MRVDLHPVYRVYIYLGELINIDLNLRGYYQVRLFPKSCNDFISVDISTVDKSSALQSSAVLPSAVTNGIGISRTVELTYIEESLKIGDVFNIKVQLCPQTDFTKTHRLLIDVELWSMDRHRPPRFDLFELDSRRSIEIDLNPSRLTAIARPLSFEYKAPSVISFSVFASLVTIMPRRRKAPPDPPISDRLREYHGAMSSELMKAIASLESFITRNSGMINMTVNLATSDTIDDAPSLVSRLENSERPWATLEAAAVQLSTRLDVLFNQLVDMFGSNDVMLKALYDHFADSRQRLMGEAFFFTEKPLIALRDSIPSHVTSLNSYVQKGKYIQRLARCPVFCPATDSPLEYCPVVFEECFGAACPSTSRTRSSTPDLNILRKSVGASTSPTSTDGLHRDGKSKSLRILRLRRKSAEALSSKRLMKQRLSADAAVGSTTDRLVSTFSADGTVHLENKTSNPSLTDIAASCGNSIEKSTLSCDVVAASAYFGDEDPEEISRLVEFVKERETTKAKLRVHCSYDGYLYSELAFHPVRPAVLPYTMNAEYRVHKAEKPAHLIVLVHGLEGSSDDLIPYRNALRQAAPEENLYFLMSSANQCETWADFDTMSRNLLVEVQDHVADLPQAADRISFIAHSMGGVIVRAALGRTESHWLHGRLHTFLTINTPHLGLAYVGRGVHWGVQFVQWWKRSRSMEQLSLRDALSFRDSFLFRLSQNSSFSLFRNILLVGAPHDLFVPSHSALLEPCKTSTKDPSALGSAYRDMLSNIYDDLLSGDLARSVVRYSTFHNCVTAKSNTFTGRAAHIAAVEDDTFIEKLFAVSALRYFV